MAWDNLKNNLRKEKKPVKSSAEQSKLKGKRSSWYDNIDNKSYIANDFAACQSYYVSYQNLKNFKQGLQFLFIEQKTYHKKTY